MKVIPMGRSSTEENYLKAIFTLAQNAPNSEAGTNQVAAYLGIKPASVNEMLKRLKDKDWVDYEKYGKIKLTKKGQSLAIQTIRKHRLWETFLYQKLGFGWEEIHEVAEELEHIHSEKLISALDKFLDYPNFDPHGDPIPDSSGRIEKVIRKKLTEVEVGKNFRVVAVKDVNAEFLQYVESVGIVIGKEFQLISRENFDGQTTLKINGDEKIISEKVAENIFVVEV
ncbi:iron (metal) dependent repressor, DtxR family [Cruoricaptor ignavus]|uniref:Transcriptional regulator MntR n=2 Tax=Cruoricaptor ignavus TaxID=1118202 RepID=A0A1M6AA70_9FLAO|nr:metal-dependent transcriptional regulator [Cruoricaptor ignavus]SHI33063.1 iron (metal) dependent repressor, DtxR family [Cruoricaptor ignavus]